MKNAFVYLLVGLLAAFLQSSVFPLFLAPNLRPNLLLLLVLLAGLKEDVLSSIVAALLLGAIHDSFSGHSLGLYVTVFLGIVFGVRALALKFNVESIPLLLLFVAGGTLLQTFLVGGLLLLADSEPVLHILLPAIPQQLSANLLCALLGLIALSRYRRLRGRHYGRGSFMYSSH